MISATSAERDEVPNRVDFTALQHHWPELIGHRLAADSAPRAMNGGVLIVDAMNLVAYERLTAARHLIQNALGPRMIPGVRLKTVDVRLASDSTADNPPGDVVSKASEVPDA